VNIKVPPTATLPFLQVEGEMAGIIREYNWSETPIGGFDKWPLSLRTTLGNILHSSFPMFLFWGKDLTCFYNDAYRPSLGSEGKHPAIGKKGCDVWPEIWPFIYPLIEQVLTTGKPAWFEDQLVPIFRNGRIEDVYWTFSYSAAFGDDGSIAGVLVTCMETTDSVISRKKIEETVISRTAELHKAHQSLLKANEYFQQLINMFKEPLQVLVPVFENGKIVDFTYKLTNEAFSAYANTTPEALKGKRVGHVFPGYFQTTGFSNVVKTFVTGNSDTWEIHYNSDGLDLYNQMSATKLNDEVIVHFTDFTKLKYLQLELMKNISELERSNQHLEEFANAASHDLKEPIRKIHLYITMLKQQLNVQLKEKELKTFEKIERATERMRLLVDDLLSYSYVSPVPHKKMEINLNEELKHVIEDLEHEIENRRAKVIIEGLPVVNGYKRQLMQMFQNLISNALKYSKADVQPEIVIAEVRNEQENRKENGDGQYHVIKIKDNGIGFDEQYAEKIFHMFTRLHGNTEYSGTGIGLSIVKKVAENHNGFVKAESEPGKGSAFFVYLPVH
jgi:signal transduction histidine kinase